MFANAGNNNVNNNNNNNSATRSKETVSKRLGFLPIAEVRRVTSSALVGEPSEEAAAAAVHHSSPQLTICRREDDARKSGKTSRAIAATAADRV